MYDAMISIYNRVFHPMRIGIIPMAVCVCVCNESKIKLKLTLIQKQWE